MTPASVPTGPRILVVDDEPSARNALVELLREEGFAVHAAADGYKALGQLEEWAPDLIITDVKMPGMDGLSLMAKVRAEHDAVGVVVMTAFGSVENAVDAMHQGADDYLTKPVHFPELLVVVRRVLDHHALRRENARLKVALDHAAADDVQVRWVGQSKSSRELTELVEQVADSDASVLVIGERGTGKQLVARALHTWGQRASREFVTLRCGGLTEPTLESELFGHEDGALAGSTGAHDGAVTRAEEGTLFLDEVHELPAAVQIKLLRLLQEHEYQRLGSDEVRTAAVRVVVATSHELEAAVEREEFRGDLYYQLQAVTIRVPPLRQRRDDVPVLAMHFLQEFASSSHKSIRGFNDRALRVLTSYDWPGNVRQLEHVVEHAVAICQGWEIEPRHLPRDVMHVEAPQADRPEIPGASMAEIERHAILTTLEHVRGSTSKAAEILGISPRKIQYRLAEYREADPSGVPAVLKK